MVGHAFLFIEPGEGFAAEALEALAEIGVQVGTDEVADLSSLDSTSRVPMIVEAGSKSPLVCQASFCRVVFW